MGDWADAMKALKQANAEYRSEMRADAVTTLTALGVSFDTKNNGAHLIVRHGGKVVDFWPGTERWRVRGQTRYAFGIDKLLKELGVGNG